jgi:hypothetical protein
MFSFKDEGYSSGNSSETHAPEVYFTKPHLKFLNRQLHILEPQGGFLDVICGMTDIYRYFEMVYHNTSWFISDLGFWIDWTCNH